jgi:hypothetical protein
MDQSVAIQETLVEGEYCVIISFPVVGCHPDRACFSLGRWDGGCGKISLEAIWEKVNQYLPSIHLALVSLPGALHR